MRTVFLLMLLTIGAPLAAQEAPAPPRVERFRLDNGLTVLIERRAQLPLVNVTCFYRVGAANEVPGITGVAHYVEHMVFRGTQNVSPADITGTFDRIGGRWNAYTELDQTLYAETVPSWALDAALRIEAERMARATFDASEFSRERGSVIAEINSYIGDAAERLGDLVRMTSFEIHPYRSNTLGYDVPAMTRDEAYRFYKDFYGPNNATLVIVGDVDAAAARALVEKYFGDLTPAPRTPEIRVVEPPQRGEKRVVLVYPGAQQHIEWAFRAPAAMHPDFPALLVLDALLSGTPHPLPLGDGEALATSRLEQAVDAAGGSGAGTTIQFSRYANLYSLRAKADPGVNLSKVEAAIEAELERVARDGVTPDELNTAWRRLTARRALAGNTVAEAAHRLAFFQALGSWALDGEIEQAAMRVTSVDLQAFVRTWLTPEQRTVGIHRIGPAMPPEISTTTSSATPQRPAPAPFVKASPVPPEALRPLALPNLATARKQLANGVVIRAAQEDGTSATILVRLGFRNREETLRNPALAWLAARVLTADPEFRTGLVQSGAILEDAGENAPTAFFSGDHLDIQLRCPAAGLSETLFLLGHALARKRFSTDEADRARQDLISDIEALTGDAAWAARQAAIQNAMIGSSLAFVAANAVEPPSAKEVNDFLASFPAGRNVLVGISGPADPLQVLDTAAQALAGIRSFSSEPRIEIRTFRFPKKRAEETEYRRPMAGKTRVEIKALSMAPGPEALEVLPMRLLDYIVGETGYAGRLGRALVEPGLTYDVYSRQVKIRSGRLLEISTATATVDLDATLATIRRELKLLSENGVEDWEVQEAKAYSLGRMIFALAQDPARVLVDSEYFGEDLLDFPARSKAILAVTREDLNRIARRYYDPALFSFGVAGALPPK
jgi:zinc protease